MRRNIYARVDSTGAVLNCVAFKRGGNWNNGANAGAFTLNLNNTPSNVNTNIGFRCASDHIPRQNVWCIFKDMHPGFTMITVLFPPRYNRRNKKSVFQWIAAVVIYWVNRQSYTFGMSLVSPLFLFQRRRAGLLLGGNHV